MSFAEFMRGKYDPTNEVYVSTLIVNMTQDEQRQILTDPFDVIWQRLWKGDTTSSDFVMSREKFSSLNIANLVAKNPSVYMEPEWGFPKGRRIRSETDFDCAIREFTEETNVLRDAFIVVDNIRLEETFMGLNNIMYRHIYFVALLVKPDLVNLNQRFTHMQNREISGLEWKTLDECRSFVRPHHVQRTPMLDALQNIVESYESEN
jgi:ADP-ribose pyrophosphatase YjhB (NUDIX family)